MRIHLKRTCCMSIGTRQTLMQLDSLDILLKDEHIKTVDSQKLLEIIIDKSLTWDKQVAAVCLNVSRRITLLKLLAKYVDQKGLNIYYKSYILPIFDYGCMIWGPCSTSNSNRQIVEKSNQNNSQCWYNDAIWANVFRIELASLSRKGQLSYARHDA